MADTAQTKMGENPSARAGPKPTAPGKKKAKGKSQILNKLATQLKFYFSDSNLWKDKFLRQKMDESEDGYISIGLLASFRKMLSLTSDLSMVVHAARMCSPLLDVSKDGQYVRRSMPLPPAPGDIDERTLYIEKLPNNVDHEMIKKSFGVFGAVTHVSLPKFKKKSTVKGFAFVEFSKKASVQNVMSYFEEEAAAYGAENEPGVSTSAETTGATNCTTACAGEADRHAAAPSGSALSSKEGTSSAEDCSFVKSRKRPHSDIESNTEEKTNRPHSDIESVGEQEKSRSQGSPQEEVQHGHVASSKKVKIKVGTEHQAEPLTLHPTVATIATGEKSPVADISSEAEKGGGNGDDETAKKRTRSHWKKKSQRTLIKEAFGDWKPSIMPKTQWKELKEEYKMLVRQQTLAAKEYYRSQREALSELSETQHQPKPCASMDETFSMGESVSDSDSADCAESTTADDSAFELAMHDPSASLTAGVAGAAASAARSGANEVSADFVAGTVLSVEWADSVNTQPWTAVLLKRSLVELSSVEFVDFKPGEHNAYLRCASADKTTSLLRKLTANSDSRNGSMRRPLRVFLLSGEEERLYWQRLAENRKKTHEERGGRCRSSRKRLAGQVQRLAAVEKKKADSKHIMFSDDDVAVMEDDITM